MNKNLGDVARLSHKASVGQACSESLRALLSAYTLEEFLVLIDALVIEISPGDRPAVLGEVRAREFVEACLVLSMRIQVRIGRDRRAQKSEDAEIRAEGLRVLSDLIALTEEILHRHQGRVEDAIRSEIFERYGEFMDLVDALYPRKYAAEIARAREASGVEA